MGMYGDGSEALYPVLVFNQNQPEKIISQLLTLIMRVCFYTHVMDYNSLMKALVSQHRNTLYQKLLLLRIRISFFASTLPDHFLSTDPRHPPVSLHLRIFKQI